MSAVKNVLMLSVPIATVPDLGEFLVRAAVPAVTEVLSDGQGDGELVIGVDGHVDSKCRRFESHPEVVADRPQAPKLLQDGRDVAVSEVVGHRYRDDLFDDCHQQLDGERAMTAVGPLEALGLLLPDVGEIDVLRRRVVIDQREAVPRVVGEGRDAGRIETEVGAGPLLDIGLEPS